MEKVSNFINKIHLGDVMDLLLTLPDKSVDMIYSDPDYNVGVKYGDKSYSKSFDKYTDWYIELCRQSLRVLKDDGNMFLINYPKQNAHLRVKYLDEACYEVLDYAWVYNSNIGHSPNRFTTAHRSVLHCRKTADNRFYKNAVAQPYQNPNDRRIKQNIANGSLGRMPYDWFYFDLVKNVSKEKTFHACQIPQELAEMLVNATTLPKDIVLIHFGGSGSEIEVCQKLKRNFIASEIDKKYHKLITDRINSGVIAEKYRLDFIKERKQESNQLTLLDKKGKYIAKKTVSKKKRPKYSIQAN